jgi:hypothetical protein
VRVLLRGGGWIEGYRRADTTAHGQVLLLDAVSVADDTGASRRPRAADSFVPVCDIQRIVTPTDVPADTVTAATAARTRGA